MTVKQGLNIQEVSIEIENQSSIKLVKPNNIVPKRFTEVHYEVLGSKGVNPEGDGGDISPPHVLTWGG